MRDEAGEGEDVFDGDEQLLLFDNDDDDDDDDDEEEEEEEEEGSGKEGKEKLLNKSNDSDICSRPACAICLEVPRTVQDSCFTPLCLHSFCTKCIVRWANFRESENKRAKCPSCRVPFENLLCYRELDGTFNGEEDLKEHPICLLKRCGWLNLDGLGRDSNNEDEENENNNNNNNNSNNFGLDD